MKKITHEFTSLGTISLGILFIRNYLGDPVVIAMIYAAGIFMGILPDIMDFKLLLGFHRNFLSHSPLSPIPIFLFMLLGGFLSFLYGIYLSLYIAALILSCWYLHILLDFLTPMGVPLFGKKKYTLGLSRFDAFVPNFLLSGIGIISFVISAGFILSYI